MFKCAQYSINILTARIVSHQADTDQTPFEGTKSTTDLDAVLVQQRLAYRHLIDPFLQADSRENGQFIPWLRQHLQPHRLNTGSKSFPIEFMTRPACL